MDLLICGSAAYEAIPCPFCTCPTCAEARRRGGKDIRTRAAYQLGQSVRIDFGPDSVAQSHRFGLLYQNLQHLFFTHSHEDHFYPEDLQQRRTGYAHLPESALLHVYGNEVVGTRLHQYLHDLPANRMRFHLLQPFQSIDLPDHDLSFIPLPAQHIAYENALMYLIRDGRRWILQGNDTGWFPQPTWDFLKSFQLDVVLLDCTCGDTPSRHGHMGAAVVLEAFARLAEQGSLAPGARGIATHFSHNGRMLHEDLEAFFKPHPIEPAFDGMIL